MTLRLFISNAGVNPVTGGTAVDSAPTHGVDLSGIEWMPAVGALIDNTAADWHATPSRSWAESLLWAVPPTFNGLVLIDDESQNLVDLQHGDKARQERAIDQTRQQLNECRAARRACRFGRYATLSPPHQWPHEAYIDELVRFGMTNELLNRQQVMYPLCYLLGPNSQNELHHYRIITLACLEAKRKFGCMVVPIVSPNIWPSAVGDDSDSYPDWSAFDAVCHELAGLPIDGLGMWQAEPHLEPLRWQRAKGGALTPSEHAGARQIGFNNISRGLSVLRDCANV